MASKKVKSANRSLQLFEIFASVRKPLTVSEVVELLEMPQSSASELLMSLVGLGYLEHYREERTYFPTLRVSMLGRSLGEMQSLTSSELPARLIRLAETTRQIVTLNLRNSIYSQPVMVQFGDNIDRTLVGSHHFRPLVCCASGWALLSGEKDKDIELIMRRTQAEHDDPYWKDKIPLALKEIQKCRERGYAYSSGHLKKHSSGIAVKLPLEIGKTPLAVSVIGTPDTMQRKKDVVVNHLNEFLAALRS